MAAPANAAFSQIAAAVALLAFGAEARGASPEERERRWFATVYAGQWAASNLGNIPLRAVDGSLEFHDAYLAAGTLSYVALPSIEVDLPRLAPVLDGSSIELEGLVAQHFGDQNHLELAFTVLWRSRDLKLPGQARLNFAFGEGMSWALSKPELEGAVRGADTHKFLNYLAFEAELMHPSVPGVSLTARLHHRSGIFGVIAPRHTGSNYLGAGLRMTLQ